MTTLEYLMNDHAFLAGMLLGTLWGFGVSIIAMKVTDRKQHRKESNWYASYTAHF